ncbi:MAG: valine--tRNA ligase [Gammaproteobacteria bacterium]|nr:valine--tRNA ligase [Gammaproteobacteria bacterium]
MNPANLQSQASVYNPKDIEQNWYNFWETQGYFKPNCRFKNSEKYSEKYSIVIPPPNVTGSLHMGHAFQYTIMDILIRFNRMDGKETLWQMGTDAAGIATQMIVERQLNQQNIKRTDLTREEFVSKVWEWKEKSGGRISKQIRRLGASVDWTRERFTMDQQMQDAVNKAFIELYDQGLIYRGNRLVNWDPVLQTALSDLEVENTEKPGHIWHIKYPLVNNTEHIIVATTRPETLLGDTAVAVNPQDPRYKDLIGREIALPLTNRKIPIIADDYVDIEFGTGAVKITPAHDFNDFEVGKRHNLAILNIFTPDAKLNNEVPEAYQNKTREEARKIILKDLESLGLLLKTEDHIFKLPIGDRSGAIVEPYLIPQWYIKIEPLAEPARTVVNNKTINFVPENYINMYNSWMDNLQDWCISRQLWWGNRIPAWYDKQDINNKTNIYVAESKQAAIKKYNLAPSTELVQESDTLDTWFAAALWPAASLGWPSNFDEHFFPTNVLVTGFDIIFFWVARMIMMGLHFNKTIPFKDVYFTGLIRDSQGQKMSKSKGNVLDPLDLIDGISLDELLEQRTGSMMQPKLAEKVSAQTKKEFPNGILPYGTDALRFTLCALASASRNINFDLKRMEGYRNFCNKLWNATRFVLMNTENKEINLDFNISSQITQLTLADQWILSELQNTILITREHLANYRFDLLAQSLYEFVWDQYCDWYLELSKATIGLNSTASSNQQANTRFILLYVLENILRLLHPVIPFITEELWQKLKIILRISSESIMIADYSVVNNNFIQTKAVANIYFIKNIIMTIRNIRGEMNISPAKTIEQIYLKNLTNEEQEILSNNKQYINLLAKVDQINFNLPDTQQTTPLCATGIIQHIEVLIPMAGLIDVKAESERLNREINKSQQEYLKLSQRLENPNFTDKAPLTVVTAEREKLAELKITVEKLEKKIQDLKNI